jgi:hypothetical protein
VLLNEGSHGTGANRNIFIFLFIFVLVLRIIPIPWLLPFLPLLRPLSLPLKRPVPPDIRSRAVWSNRLALHYIAVIILIPILTLILLLIFFFFAAGLPLSLTNGITFPFLLAQII